MGQRAEKEEFREKIKTAIEQMNQDDEVIDSVDSLREKLADRHQITVGGYLIRKVLRQDLKMSFRKIKSITMTENSPKSKILRQ